MMHNVAALFAKSKGRVIKCVVVVVVVVVDIVVVDVVVVVVVVFVVVVVVVVDVHEISNLLTKNEPED